MVNNVKAVWNLSLDVTCPSCGHYFDLMCDPDLFEWSGASVCESIEGYDTTCPECDHEFKSDFIY